MSAWCHAEKVEVRLHGTLLKDHICAKFGIIIIFLSLGLLTSVLPDPRWWVEFLSAMLWWYDVRNDEVVDDMNGRLSALSVFALRHETTVRTYTISLNCWIGFAVVDELYLENLNGRQKRTSRSCAKCWNWRLLNSRIVQMMFGSSKQCIDNENSWSRHRPAYFFHNHCS